MTPRGLAALTLLLVVAIPLHAAAASVVPPGSWIYPALDYLKTRGLVPLWAGVSRPMPIADLERAVAEALRRAETASLSAYDRALLDRLRREVEGPAATAGIAYAQFGRNVPYAMFTGGADVGWIVGAQRLQLGAAALTLSTGAVQWLAGRSPIGWGPGVGGLVFSEFAGGLDRVQASLEWRAFRLTRVVGWLDGGRSLVATRVDIIRQQRLRISLTDVVVMQGGPFWMYVLNPLSFATSDVIIRQVRGPQGFNDNVLFAIDAEWLVRPGLRIYGEALVDDLTIPTNGARFPSRWGATIGADVLEAVGPWDLRLQYTIVPNWTYSAVAASSHYLLRGLPLGHPLGADFDVWHARLARRLDVDQHLAVWASLIRKGEGRVGVIWTDMDEAIREAFLSGTVERSIIVGVERSWAQQGWHYTVGPWLAHRTNAWHVAGLVRLDWGVSLAISGRF